VNRPIRRSWRRRRSRSSASCGASAWRSSQNLHRRDATNRASAAPPRHRPSSTVTASAAGREYPPDPGAPRPLPFSATASYKAGWTSLAPSRNPLRGGSPSTTRSTSTSSSPTERCRSWMHIEQCAWHPTMNFVVLWRAFAPLSSRLSIFDPWIQRPHRPYRPHGILLARLDAGVHQLEQELYAGTAAIRRLTSHGGQSGIASPGRATRGRLTPLRRLSALTGPLPAAPGSRGSVACRATKMTPACH